MPKSRLLNCGHITKFENNYCSQCQGIKIIVPEYEAICLTCRLHRSYGYNKRNASLMLTRHRNKYPMHATRLKFGNDIVYTNLPTTRLQME